MTLIPLIPLTPHASGSCPAGRLEEEINEDVAHDGLRDVAADVRACARPHAPDEMM